DVPARGRGPLEPDRGTAGIAGVIRLAGLLGREQVAGGDGTREAADRPGGEEVVVPRERRAGTQRLPLERAGPRRGGAWGRAVDDAAVPGQRQRRVEVVVRGAGRGRERPGENDVPAGRPRRAGRGVAVDRDPVGRPRRGGEDDIARALARADVVIGGDLG